VQQKQEEPQNLQSSKRPKERNRNVTKLSAERRRPQLHGKLRRSGKQRKLRLLQRLNVLNARRRKRLLLLLVPRHHQLRTFFPSIIPQRCFTFIL